MLLGAARYIQEDALMVEAQVGQVIGEIGVKNEPNCVPILPGLVQKSAYLSYTAPLCVLYTLNISVDNLLR